MMKTWALFLFGTSVVVTGCGTSVSEKEQPVPTAKAAPAGQPATSSVSAKPQSRRIGGIKFDFPADWEEKPTSSTVLLGEYSVPGSGGAARLTFSTAGGGTAANLDRWKGQFQRGPNDPEPNESQLTIDGKPASFIELNGSFQDMFGGGGTKSDWQLLGVAIPIDGDHNYFVKLTGPRQTVSARKAELIQFLESARKE